MKAIIKYLKGRSNNFQGFFGAVLFKIMQIA